MKNKEKKKWTILIYADGNNEMEEVIYKSIEDCIGVGINKDINVVIQIGILSSGVKRYYLNSSEPIVLQDLSKTNMADPNNLYNFVSFGTKEFPAHHYMLILSGHGADFIGGLTDTSLEDNYIMGIPEMVKAIGLGSIHSRSIIDILILDMCFMNSIEILYELTQYNESIKSMITYTNFAPYSGLNYNILIRSMGENLNVNDMDLFIKHIINNLNFELTAYKLDKLQLELIKKQFSHLAFDYLNNKGGNENPINLVKSDNINEINSLIESIIIYSKTKFNGINSSINIICHDISKLIGFYHKLGFSKNNYWTNLLYNNLEGINSSPINRVKVRTADSSTALIHYILKF
ncbi:hypothetical protein GCM10008905_24480 [Clostridium malenominatum]|uniref:Clostripain n=1 Tax=Clostridium malenominatum TaxID=1539 RepID=A0ABP3UCY8_9CLOT